jgi:hypothetical protein
VGSFVARTSEYDENETSGANIIQREVANFGSRRVRTFPDEERIIILTKLKKRYMRRRPRSWGPPSPEDAALTIQAAWRRHQLVVIDRQLAQIARQQAFIAARQAELEARPRPPAPHISPRQGLPSSTSG